MNFQKAYLLKREYFWGIPNLNQIRKYRPGSNNILRLLTDLLYLKCYFTQKR